MFPDGVDIDDMLSKCNFEHVVLAWSWKASNINFRGQYGSNFSVCGMTVNCAL